MSELRPWVGKLPVAEPPLIDGYRLIRNEKLDLKRVSLLGLLLAPLWLVIFALLVSVLGGVDEFGGTLSIVNIVVGISFAVLLIVLHELVHGFAVLLTANRPSFGAGPGFFYTTCHKPLSWRSYAFVLLAPFIFINSAAVILGSIFPGVIGWALFLSTLNTMGSGGDLWMFIRILNAPRAGLIMDLASGFAIYDVEQPAGMPQATTASSIDS